MAKVVIEIDGLLDVQEALGELPIGYATLFRWIKKGDILPIKIGDRTYITQSDVQRLKVERQTRN